jgi:hypothetical protein
MILNFIWIEFIHITMNNNTLQIIVLTPHSLCATTYQLAIFLLCLLVCPIYFLLPLIENNYCGFCTNLICIKFVIIDSYFQLERVLFFKKKVVLNHRVNCTYHSITVLTETVLLCVLGHRFSDAAIPICCACIFFKESPKKGYSLSLSLSTHNRGCMHVPFEYLISMWSLPGYIRCSCRRCMSVCWSGPSGLLLQMHIVPCKSTMQWIRIRVSFRSMCTWQKIMYSL